MIAEKMMALEAGSDCHLFKNNVFSAYIKGRKEQLMRDKLYEIEAMKKVDNPEWVTQYQRLIDRKDKAVVRYENGICSGCHMKLQPSVAHDVKKGNTIVCCDYCGRILY